MVLVSLVDLFHLELSNMSYFPFFEGTHFLTYTPIENFSVVSHFLVVGWSNTNWIVIFLVSTLFFDIVPFDDVRGRGIGSQGTDGRRHGAASGQFGVRSLWLRQSGRGGRAPQ